MEITKLTYLGDILSEHPEWIPDFDNDCRTNDFVNTKRFSPVIYDEREAMPDKANPEYDAWWLEQYKRCITGYVVPKATRRGHDIWIPGRYYFYLNFWKIQAKLEGVNRKGLRNPRFTSLDYFKAMSIEVMFYERKDQAYGKARQKGFSEFIASNVAYNFIFIPYSINVIVAGVSDYSEHTMENVTRGLDDLATTEFHKRRSPDRASFKRAMYIDKVEDVDEYGIGMGTYTTILKGYGSEIYCLTAKDNTQAVSRLTPFFIVYEEIGKWKKGSLIETTEFVAPSLRAEGEKTGYQVMIGCVCKGTKVYNNKGERVNIEDLKKEDGIIGFTADGIYKDTIEHINLPQKKKCFRIKTKNGGYLECSHDHPLLITNYATHYSERKYINGKREHIKRKKRAIWREAAKLVVGDQIIMPGKINIFGDKEMFDPYLVGILIGDGSYGFDKTPVLSNCDSEIIKYVKERYDCKVERSYVTNDRKIYEEIRIRSITKQLRELNIYGQTGKTKQLPLNIHEYRREDIIALVAGLYDTDGGIYESTGLRKRFVINITQLSKTLIYELKSILLRFGINSNLSIIRNKDRVREYNGKIIKDKSEYYSLQIAGSVDLYKFAMTFQLKVNYKQAMLERIKKEVVPKTISVIVVNAEKGKAGEITDLGEIHYDRIVSIEDIGAQYVYNLKTKDSHTYLANDFVTHNTGGDIEESVLDVQKIMYNPAAYGIKAYKNIFEEDLSVTTGNVGCFIPGYLFEIIDDDGNSLIAESIASILKDRENKSNEQQYRAATQKPLYLSEMFMVASGGYFGRDIAARLNDRKRFILNHRELQVISRYNIEWIDHLDWSKGVRVEPDEEGVFIIIEHPQKDEGGKHYINLYNAATDSYDKSESETSESKGSCTIWKNYLNANSTYRFWVARLTQRPTEEEGGSPKFYENTIKLCVYYGYCQNLIEYSNVLIFDYYKRWGMEYLLKERPSLVISQYVNDPKAHQRYGVEQSFIPHALKMLKEEFRADDYALVHRLYDLEMIEKFIAFRTTDGYNCDITIGCALNIAAATEDRELDVYREEEEEELEDFGGYTIGLSNVISRL